MNRRCKDCGCEEIEMRTTWNGCHMDVRVSCKKCKVAFHLSGCDEDSPRDMSWRALQKVIQDKAMDQFNTTQRPLQTRLDKEILKSMKDAGAPCAAVCTLCEHSSGYNGGNSCTNHSCCTTLAQTAAEPNFGLSGFTMARFLLMKGV